MNMEKDKEKQYIDLAYRSVEYVHGRVWSSLSEDEKKFVNKTLSYLDNLIEKLDEESKFEEEDEVDGNQNDDLMTAYKERCSENVVLRKQLTETMKELINANNCILSLQEKLTNYSKTTLVSYGI